MSATPPPELDAAATEKAVPAAKKARTRTRTHPPDVEPAKSRILPPGKAAGEKKMVATCDVGGILYFVGADNTVYQAEDVMSQTPNPRVIGKMTPARDAIQWIPPRE